MSKFQSILLFYHQEQFLPCVHIICLQSQKHDMDITISCVFVFYDLQFRLFLSFLTHAIYHNICYATFVSLFLINIFYTDINQYSGLVYSVLFTSVPTPFPFQLLLTIESSLGVVLLSIVYFNTDSYFFFLLYSQVSTNLAGRLWLRPLRSRNWPLPCQEQVIILSIHDTQMTLQIKE